jgi:hypothetical protein
VGVMMSGRADNESLMCYQTGGLNEYGKPLEWKLYRLSEIEDLEIRGEHFGGERPGYDPDNLPMKTVYCRVLLSRENESQPEYVPNTLVTKNRKTDYRAATVPVDRFLTHNELMQRFHFTHSAAF